MRGILTKITAIILAFSMVFLTACSAENIAQAEKMISEAYNEQVQPVMQDVNDAEEDADHVYTIDKEKKKMYFAVPENESEIELAFMDGVKDIPYISMENAKDTLIMAMKELDVKDYDLKLEADDDKVTLTRESGYTAVFDFTEDTVEFYDYDAFLKKQENTYLLDVITLTGYNDKGEPEYLQAMDTSFERYGNPVTFRPGEYGIDMICQDGEYYIPVQFLSDIILSRMKLNIVYNGENVCIVPGGRTDFLEDQYYIADPPKERSDALIDFNYRELCLAMDAFYGLKEQHHITSFDSLFRQTGLIEPLMSKDPQEAGQALADLTLIYLDDRHTGFGGKSYMMTDTPTLKFGNSYQQSFVDGKAFKSARDKVYPDGVPGYEEVGNTAFITIDGFSNDDSIDYYSDSVKAEDHLDDTFGLMIYAFSQITRDQSPIKNVVLDLTLDEGGSEDAGAYVIGAFIGNGSISVMNSLTDALMTENFKADLNLDRKFDDSDNLLDYNLFCLTSPYSFSCANLVPSVLKNSHKVTVLGQTSGGGTCVLYRMSTADGCVFQMSGPLRMSYTKNGSFYEIDQGIEPDFVISRPEQFYDRKYIDKYVNELMGN